MVERLGCKVTKYERNFENKEKKVDVAIAHQMTKDAYSGVVRPGLDEMTLVAGDSDYVPVVNDLVAGGFIVHVAFWGLAAKELREPAARFVSLDSHFAFLSRAAKT